MAGYLQCVLKMMGQLNWWKGDPGEQLGKGVQLDTEVQLDAEVQLDTEVQLDAEVQLDEQTLCLTLLVSISQSCLDFLCHCECEGGEGHGVEN